jgi:SAM-dependent methyltransferase
VSSAASSSPLIPPTGPIHSTQASFRDPAGAVVVTGDRVFRIVGAAGRDAWAAFSTSTRIREFEATGKVVATRPLDDAAASAARAVAAVDEAYRAIDGQLLIEHERIAFPSYPYEWSPEMLEAAGMLTLEMNDKLLDEGCGLKDSTPYNIMFRGAAPVFLDVLSCERRQPTDPIWIAEAQFQRTFVLPLLAHRHLGIGLHQTFLTHRDGVEPDELYRVLGWRRCLRRPLFGCVMMPALLSGKASTTTGLYERHTMSNADKARFVVRASYERARRALQRATPPRRDSKWTGYMQGSNNYDPEQFTRKEQFVDAALAAHAPRRVLDIGCNTGHFSVLAAKRSASVVAIDYDEAVVGQVWTRARAEGLDILPLVVDLSRPTPATGWRNREASSFLDRADGRFDLVLMLAVVHHLLVTERVPLDDIVSLASELSRDLVVVEFVSPEDSMFKALARGRDALYQGLTREAFEGACRRRFDILRTDHTDGTHRWLYLLKRRAA